MKPKIVDLIKEKVMGKSTGDNGLGELNAALDNIIRIEQERDVKKIELESARQHLSNEQARSLDGDDGADVDDAVSQVVREQAQLDSLEGLLRQAKDKAIGMVAANVASQRQRLEEVGKELTDVRGAIDTRRIKAWAEFAKKHGLQVSWPTRHNGGSIHLPALSVDGDELEQIADAAVTTVHVDSDAGKLHELLAEKQRINLVIKLQPSAALESLLSERRRQK